MPLPLPVFLSACLLLTCTLPTVAATIDKTQCRKVPTGPGPHSLLMLPGEERLLVSSHDRRHFERHGDIYEHLPGSGTMRKLPRLREPDSLAFRPHNMAVRQSGEDTLLYLINHDDDTPNSIQHSVVVYAITADGLEFRQQLRHPLLSSPNHIALAPDGDIYISNDRRNGRSTMELALRQKKATIVHHRQGKGWRIVAEGLSFPNGVHAEQDRVLVSKTFGSAVLAYQRNGDGSLGKPRTVISLPLLDGIFPSLSRSVHYTISHASLFDFLQHKRNGRHASAATIHAVNADTGASSVIFSDDGLLISGLSAVIETRNAFFLGQSFEPFLLRCPPLRRS